MRKTLALLTLLLFLGLTISCQAETAEEGPLTLMKPPQTGGQTSQQQIAPAGQPDEFFDIHGPVPYSPEPPYLLISGITLAVLLLLAGIYWFMKNRKKPLPPAIPPWDTALAELNEARKLFNPSQSLLYMERVSSILRSYIESRFAIRSTRQTTREFLQKVKRTAKNTETLQRSRPELQACLEQADMAKFAHRIPDQENMEQMERAVTAFIRKTQPAPSGKGGKS